MKKNMNFKITSGEDSLIQKIATLIFLLMFGLIPGGIFIGGAHDWAIPTAKSINWDDTTGTVLSSEVTDTGQKKKVSVNDSRSKIVNVYEGLVNYSYNDQGNDIKSFFRRELLGKDDVRKFNKKFKQNAILKLKINPEDRSEVIVKPNYAGPIAFLIIGFVISMTFFWFAIIRGLPLLFGHTEHDKTLSDSERKRNGFGKNQTLSVDSEKESKKMTFEMNYAAFMICLIFGSLPLIVFSVLAINLFIPELETRLWDDLNGTIIEATVKDTGRTKVIEDGEETRTVRLYDTTLTYSYQESGETLVKTIKEELAGSDKAKEFRRKYHQGEIVKLKVNPQDRSDIVIKPNYIGTVAFLVLGSIFSLGWFVEFIIMIPLRRRRINQEMQDPSSLRKKLEASGLRNIDYRKVESTVDSDIEWTNVNSTSSSGFMYKVEYDDSRMVISKKVGASFYIFIGVFLVVGIAFFFKEPVLSIIMIMIAIGAWCLVRIDKKRYFDKSKGYYWVGQEHIDQLIRNSKAVQLSQIKVLQLLYYKDPHPVKSGGDRHDMSHYELNLVLKDNKRVNVYSDGYLKHLLKLTDQLSEFLRVSVVLDPKIDKERLLLSL